MDVHRAPAAEDSDTGVQATAGRAGSNSGSALEVGAQHTVLTRLWTRLIVRHN